MTRTARRLTLAALALVALAALAGCKATGGGYIQSAFNPANKATFGFTWQSDDTKSTVKGNWSDGPVKFKIDSGGVVTLTDGQDGCAWGEGTYTSTSRTSPGSGNVYLYLCDYGEPGPTNGDYLEIHTEGVFAYDNSGSLNGGNLQVKK